jgi:hypothetical protein
MQRFDRGFPPVAQPPIFVSPISATWPAYLILLDLIILIIVGEEYKSRSSLLCNYW